MSVALRTAPPMSLAEFLEWEARQEAKWEFDGRGPVAMAGGTEEHAAVQANLAAALVPRLRGTPCRFRGSDLKVETELGTARYPDGFVACSPAEPGASVVRDPVVVFEVLSPSTQEEDRTEKMAEYRATPSVRSYVMLEQSRPMATVFSRGPAAAGGGAAGADDGWVGRIVRAGEALALPEIGVELPLDELYDGVAPATAPAAGAGEQMAPGQGDGAPARGAS